MTTTRIDDNIGDAYVNFKDFQHALGIAYYKLGDFRKAIEYHQRYLEKFRKKGETRQEKEERTGILASPIEILEISRKP